MDESWNIPMGLILPRRRSTDASRRRPCPDGEGLGPNDFRDVFGGPPRTVLLRRFSGELSPERDRRNGSIYDEIFRSSERLVASGGERRLPGFRIPPAEGRLKTKLGFYDDIFGSEGVNRKSKLKSTEKWSGSELSPARVCSGDDSVFADFASKLRPINIPSRWHNCSPPSTFSTVETTENQHGAVNHSNLPSRSCFIANTSILPQHSHTNFSYCFSPPDSISFESAFDRNQKKPIRGSFLDSNIGSPSSVISSVFLDTMGSFGFKGHACHPSCESEVEKMVMTVEERDVAENPFVIEVDSHGTTETNEGAAAVDEAIAWAKEKFFSHASAELKNIKSPQTSHKQMEHDERR